MRPGPGGRRRLGVVHAAGLVLVLAGLAVLGIAAWQAWGGSAVAADGQRAAARQQAAAWRAAPAPAAEPGGIPVADEPALAGTVAVLRVPRFGAEWTRLVRQGVDEAEVLNSVTAGVGHYPGTAMPGGLGNFAIAAHDTGWGDAFRGVPTLRIGDEIHVQTADGTYTYAFRNFQWVQPDGVGVLLPVPDRPGVAATDRLITLTTCDPPYDAQERLIAYGVLTGFEPAG